MTSGYLGDVRAGQTVYLPFDTQVNGLPTTASAATVKVYKNAVTTTEVATGVTTTLDFDALVGMHMVAIDLSSDGAFYAAGNDFTVALTALTLSGSTVRIWLGSFSIENRRISAASIQAIWDALTTALTTAGSIGKRIADFLTGDAYVRLGAPAGASVSADVAAIKAVLPAALDANGFIKADVEDWKGATAPAMTGDAFARLGAPAGASVSVDVAAVKTDTAAIKLKTDNLPASPSAVGSAMTLTSGERDSVADALLDRSAGVETGLTPRQSLRLISAAEAGKLSGAATSTVTIRNAVADSKARITATVDADGNRSAVTTDVT